MNVRTFSFLMVAAFCAIPTISLAQDAHFHNAPASTIHHKNPLAGQRPAVVAGARLYAANCSACHGATAQGSGNIPALSQGRTQSAPDGELFWFITTGSVGNGMPAWGSLSEQQRWQIVAYLKSLKTSVKESKTGAAPEKYAPVKTNAPLPEPPYADFRVEQPGKIRKISAQDLPAPYRTDSANNGPQLVARPRDAWPKAPDGFTVQLYATGLDNPRLIRTAPDGDFFLAESSSGKIEIFRGITTGGATAWATISSPITLLMSRKEASMAGPGGTSAAIRIRGTTASILN